MSEPIAKWSPRDNFSADKHQQLVDAINAFNPARTNQKALVKTPFGSAYIESPDPFRYIPCKVKLTGQETDYGKYKGYLCRGSTISNPNTGGSPGNVQEPEGMDVPSTSGNEDCLVINTTEDGQSGWILNTFPAWVTGFISGKSTDGRYMVEFTSTALPKPTARYQVLTPVDDTLSPIWTTLRFI